MERKGNGLSKNVLIASLALVISGYHLHSSPHFLYVEQLNLSCFFCWRDGNIFFMHVFIAGEPRVMG